VCERVWRNLTLAEWRQFMGPDLPYERTCPNLPLHPSVLEESEKRVRAGDVAGAVAFLQRIQERAQWNSDLTLRVYRFLPICFVTIAHRARQP